VHPYFDLPTPIAIGHRGAAGEAPENTLVSFERAAVQGVAVLESDVHLSRDGEVVILHDDLLERTTDGRGPARERTLAELRRLDAGHRFTPDGGRSFPFRGRGISIPTLAEVLERFPAMRFNLEIKEATPGLLERTIELVAARADRILLAAADDRIMARLRDEVARRGVAVAIGASAGDVAGFVRAALEDKPPAPGPMALQVPAEVAGRPLVTPRFVEHAHAHGLPVHVWTINDPPEIERLLDLGVDGVMSDFPARVVAALARRASRAKRGAQ
jgi:glycerophosphoryl diester phosphodiesterase